jgi:hypothetical protein
MTDLSTIRLIPFYGKSEEWTTWTEKVLSQGKTIRLMKIIIWSRRKERKLAIAVAMNELAYTELILSIDDKTSSAKVEFNLVKGFKNKDCVDGNAIMAWQRLRNKFELSFALSLVKLEKQFYQCSLKK